MKRSAIVLMAALLVALSIGMAFSEEKKEGEGIEVEAGIKMWYNKWKSQDPTPIFGGTTDFDASTLVGPAVEVKFPYHFYIEGSYLVSLNDYNSSQKISSNRKDLDLAVGYRFIPEIGIFVGYKDVSMDWKMAGLFPSSGSLELKGPLFGLRGDVPVSEVISIYATYAYLKTKLESKEAGFPTTNNDAPGSVWELGIKAAFSRNLSGTLGYKVESTKEHITNIKDTFSGPTLGVMYAF